MAFRRRLILTALIASVAVASATIGVAFVIASVQGAPFRMTLKSVNGLTVVQFAQPDRNLVSDEFPVDLVLDKPQTVELRSGQIAIPGITVDFYDITLLPGRFQIRVGRSQFDIMSHSIEVDGKDHAWHRS